MIKNITFKGKLISECSLPGEKSADGMTMNYTHGIRLSKDRWMLAFDTVFNKGRDVWRGIFYQIRKDSPDGEVIVEKELAGWREEKKLENGDTLIRKCGQPTGFGVPKEALLNGKVPENANIFHLQWVTYPALIHPDGTVDKTRQIAHGFDEGDCECFCEAIHFRLNDSDDDIEIVSPAVRLHEVGKPENSGHAWRKAVPDNEDCTEWVDSITGWGTLSVAICKYRFNSEKKIYEWIQTSPFRKCADRKIGETNLVKLGQDDYVLAVRSFSPNGNTCWHRFSDPFGEWGDFTASDDTVGQRYVFICGDGEMRIICNNQKMTPYGDRRNPLYGFTVNPDDFSYSDRVVMMDAREQKLKLPNPFLDHVHLFEPQGSKQLLSIRTMTMAQVWRSDEETELTPEMMEEAGCYYVEIEYDEECNSAWDF